MQNYLNLLKIQSLCDIMIETIMLYEINDKGECIMEDGINIFYPNGGNDLGRVVISPTEITIYKKSIATIACFGLLSSILDKGKKNMTISISDIDFGTQERFRLNKNAYHITMKDGTKYVLIFDRPKTTIPYLESLISANRG